jgi:hypothetical protein
MKGAIILTGILMMTVIVLSGCGSTIVCNSPYIRHEQGCCLDTNDNSICDEDEGNIVIEQEEPEVEEEEEAEEEAEEELEEEEEEPVEIPELTPDIEGFEDFEIVLASGTVGEDVIEMAIELAKAIGYDDDIRTKDEFDITGFERIYLIKEKDTTVTALNEFIIAVGDGAPTSIISNADDLADGIDYDGSILKLDEVDFTTHERAIYLITES